MYATILETSAFIQNISSFPTAIYTVLFGVCIVFWFVAALGLVDLDAMGFDLDMDVDLDIDVDIDGIDLNDSGDLGDGVLPGLLLRFGLVGVPVSSVIFLIPSASIMLVGSKDFFGVCSR